MQNRHQNRELYFREQVVTTRNFVIPYIEKIVPVTNKLKVFEIGCGEGGNLLPFLDRGCKVTGIDLSENKINLANNFLSGHPNFKNLKLITDDIYNAGYLNQTFDLIFLRDVIEHIPDQKKFMHKVSHFLSPGGKIFLGFPPWQNPFGGHQQIINHRFLSKLPYFHLLPLKTYRTLLEFSGINKATIEGLTDIKKTGLSIERFEKILKSEGYQINQKTFFLINPNYETKFRIKARKQIRIISAIPWLRNFFTTAVYYIVSDNRIPG